VHLNGSLGMGLEVDLGVGLEVGFSIVVICACDVAGLCVSRFLWNQGRKLWWNLQNLSKNGYSFAAEDTAD
jgi:hypothetical protein